MNYRQQYGPTHMMCHHVWVWAQREGVSVSMWRSARVPAMCASRQLQKLPWLGNQHTYVLPGLMLASLWQHVQRPHACTVLFASGDVAFCIPASG